MKEIRNRYKMSRFVCHMKNWGDFCDMTEKEYHGTYTE